jgi:hypothetical protein
MDERLNLICGPGTIQNINNPEVTLKIAEFAAAHGWSFTRHEADSSFGLIAGQRNEGLPVTNR